MQKWLSLTEKATSAQWGGPNAVRSSRGCRFSPQY